MKNPQHSVRPKAEGVLEAHPLRYAVRLLGCDFNGGQLFLPHVELPPEAAAEGAEAPEAEAEPEVPDSPSQAGRGWHGWMAPGDGDGVGVHGFLGDFCWLLKKTHEKI